MKKFIKKYQRFIVYIGIFLILTLPLPYYVETPGGLINLQKRIDIEKSYSVKGSMNMAYVSSLKGNVANVLFSFAMKNWELIPKKDIVASNEKASDTSYRDHFLLKESNQNAIILAYQKANKKVIIKNKKVYVTYVYDKAITNLKIKDQIISINGIDIFDKKDINTIINSLNYNDKVDIEVKRNGKNIIKTAKVINLQNNKIIGIMVGYDRNIITKPNIKIKAKNSESGPSGGLMMSLAIFNSLTNDDLTKGKIIAGTGTIDEKGNVGEIDGIKHKILGANKNKAEIFLVPYENYKEAINIKKQKKLHIKIVKVKIFEEAIDKLKKMK